MNDLSIKKVTINDLDSLQKISQQTFIETFAADNTEENMKKYLSESFSADNLTAEINNNDTAFYFATCADTIVGYLKINFGSTQTELQDKNAMEIERIYVLKDWHGKMVGQVLYNKAIDAAKEKRCSYVWLGVWEKNLRAIQFYKKNGFEAFDKHLFILGDDEQTDIMMKLSLQ